MPARLRFLLCLLVGFLTVGLSSGASAEADLSAAFLDGFYRVKAFERPIDVSGITFSTPIEGQSFSLSARQGRWVLLNVWATWCPPCVEELPKLDRLKYLKAGKDFDVLAVSVDRRLTAKRVSYYLKRWEIKHLESLHDDGKRLEAQLDIAQLPVTYLINPQGMVVMGLYGPANWSSRRAQAFVEMVRKNPDGLLRYGNKNGQAQNP